MLFIDFRGIRRIDGLRELIQERFGALQAFEPRITSAHVVVESSREPTSGQLEHRARIRLSVSEGHFAIDWDAYAHAPQESLEATLARAFDAAHGDLERWQQGQLDPIHATR